jgi:hypothetical protein
MAELHVYWISNELKDIYNLLNKNASKIITLKPNLKMLMYQLMISYII